MTDTAHFGSRKVPLADKQALVDDVFRSVAQPLRSDERPDVVRAASRLEGCAGRRGQSAEKSATSRSSTSPAAPATSPLRVIAAGGERTKATVCDISADMLAVGRERAAARGLGETLTFIEGNAEALPFADRSFDAATIAFGIRNVPRIETALAEAFRVLKIGGRFLCLEFSAVDVPGLDRLYELYSFNVIPALGRAVVGDAESYRYLVESIRRFPRPEDFAAMLRAAGFARVSFQPMTGGIVALHSGWRL